jgi:hypothetical protein
LPSEKNLGCISLGIGSFLEARLSRERPQNNVCSGSLWKSWGSTAGLVNFLVSRFLITVTSVSVCSDFTLSICMEQFFSGIMTGWPGCAQQNSRDSAGHRRTSHWWSWSFVWLQVMVSDDISPSTHTSPPRNLLSCSMSSRHFPELFCHDVSVGCVFFLVLFSEKLPVNSPLRRHIINDEILHLINVLELN